MIPERSVVIPSTLFYPLWGRIWLDFLSLANVSCYPGPETNQSILDLGLGHSCEGFCLPLKIFCGHIVQLAKQNDDLILLPTLSSNRRETSFLCHLQQRARDIALNLELVPPERLISPYFTYDDQMALEDEGFLELADRLGIPFEVARKTLREVDGRETAFRRERKNRGSGKGLRIALTGHPYITQDAWLGDRIRQTLKQLGATSTVPDCAGFSLTGLPPTLFHFTFEARAGYQIDQAMDDPEVDGVIYLQAFQCGPDFNTAIDAARRKKNKPFLSFVLDHNQAEGGFKTRLEAFLDLISKKKEVLK